MTDEKLIALIKKKPEQGIAASIDLYGGAVRTICSSVLENREDIEEADSADSSTGAGDTTDIASGIRGIFCYTQRRR